LSNV
jgi:hypothetical protein